MIKRKYSLVVINHVLISLGIFNKPAHFKIADGAATGLFFVNSSQWVIYNFRKRGVPQKKATERTNQIGTIAVRFKGIDTHYTYRRLYIHELGLVVLFVHIKHSF